MIGAVITPIATPRVEWIAIAPEVALFGAALVIILARSLFRHGAQVYNVSLIVAVAGVGAAGALVGVQWNDVRSGGSFQAVGGMIAVDGFGAFLATVILLATLAAILLGASYLVRLRIEGPETLALLLMSATGMIAIAQANDLIVVFVALEVLSIPLYVMAAIDRARTTSLEAGLKYFLLGAFASAIFLYGVALTYGATGTTSLPGIAAFLAHNTVIDNGTLVAGLALLIVGLAFEVSAVPFHMWTPDVYEGAPTPITGFMASATKAAGFAALLRVLVTAFDAYRVDWRPAIFAIAVLSLVVGSVLAIVQTDIKRMLAYSSITHVGYILVGLQAATDRGIQAALFYLLVYAFMVIGSFGVVMLVSRREDDAHSLEDYRGLAQRHPVLAGVFAFLLLAQAGVPFTGGFVAKLEVFAAGIAARSYALVIVGVLAAVVAAYFYLRVVVLMYMGGPADEETRSRRPVPVDPAAAAVLTATVAAVLFVGFLPGTFLHFAHDASLLF